MAVSDELLAMGQTERTARIASDLGIHQGLAQEWNETDALVAGFLVGAAVYDVWYGPGWDSYRDAVLPEVDMSRRDAGAYLDNHDFVTPESMQRFIEEALTP